MDGFTPGAVDPKYKNHGLLIAYDPVKHEERWTLEHPVTINGGVLSTAGNLVVQGTPGTLYAYDATGGKTLWSYDTHSVVLGAPSTVMLHGKQIILVPAGDGEAVSSSKMPRLITTAATINAPSRLLAFALDGQAELPPTTHKAINKPPLPREPKELAAKGSAVFASHGGAQCHGENLVISGNGRIPDLRNTAEPLFKLMPRILRQGMFKSVGMPVFPKLTDEDIASLRAYIVDEAWNAYQKQGRGASPP